MNVFFLNFFSRKGPWQDICCQVFGESARDLAWHFVQRWNLANRKLNKSGTCSPPCCFISCFNDDTPLRKRRYLSDSNDTKSESFDICRYQKGKHDRKDLPVFDSINNFSSSFKKTRCDTFLSEFCCRTFSTAPDR